MKLPNVVDPEYLAWLRTKPCAAADRPLDLQTWSATLHRCTGRVQVSHESHGIHHDDDRAFPACAQVHADYHSLARSEFMSRYGFCPHCMSKLYREIYEAERSFV